MFKEIKANARSMARRKLVFGIGINDSDYMIEFVSEGKRVMCPYYRVWTHMMTRCYSANFHIKNPTYAGCFVCEEWFVFSSFKLWMVKKEWQGMELDKDIKVKGNKIYSPDNCLFIPRSLNGLLNNHAAKRGLYPIGVHLHKATGKFMATISCGGKRKHLGCFETDKKASSAYQKAKKEKISQLITDNTYPMATQFLAQHI